MSQSMGASAISARPKRCTGTAWSSIAASALRPQRSVVEMMMRLVKYRWPSGVSKPWPDAVKNESRSPFDRVVVDS